MGRSGRRETHNRNGIDWATLDALLPQAEWPEGDGPPWKRGAPETPPDPFAPGAWTELADVAPRPVRWLWPGLLPTGKLTVLAGDPGTGKSFLTLDWAARVSAGRGFPAYRTESSKDQEIKNQDGGGDGGLVLDSLEVEASPQGVILFCGEDDPADTVRPRLEALGADVSRITLAGQVTTPTRGVRQDGTNEVRRGYDLAADLPRLRARLDRQAADGRPVGLVVVDPLAAFTATGNRNHERATRAILDPLAALAAETDVAVVAVLHLRKERGGPAVLGPLGSIAQAAVARSVLLVSEDPADPAGSVLRPGKANLAKRAGVMPFKITGGTVRYGAVRRATPGPAKSQRERATAWIRAYLADGPKRASDAMRDGLAAGIGRSTLKLARRDLGLAKHRFHGPRGDASDPAARAAGAYWVWALPGQDPGDAA
ncbi:AAA family ATPase [Alienimonas chondri]|uniref:AAA family ATPase n=1 Tax=Alienimonas chondri TaxID=2681879 RepID=A0ABX1VJP3_9PLAN|nr:AAA family ATPase [Alienimonas chondri]NNJ27666.1 hypothetical protein [Alienimonas chondri]